MPEPITLKKVVARGANYQLEISSLEKPLLVPSEVVHEHRLVDNIVLTESQLSVLQSAAEVLACDQKVGRLLSAREHSIGEIRLKLKKKGFSDDAIAATVSRYRKLGLLDDTRYARMLAESSLKKNPSGRAFLVGVLQKKQVSRSLAERTVDTLLRDVDEVDSAVQSLQKRWSLFSQFNLETARKKAYNYLSRRGVSYVAAKAAFERLADEEHLK